MNKNEIKDVPIQELDTQEDIISKIEYSVTDWFKFFQENIENYQDDYNFALGNQWEARDIGEYELRQKVYLTLNYLYTYVLNIVGEQRQASPQIKVVSLDNKTPQNLINIYEGLTKQIAYNSTSSISYQTAFMNALLGGFGAWRLVIDYENEKSFNKVIQLMPIVDPLNCYFDSRAQHVTKCDGEFCGVYTKMSREEFKIRWPEIEQPKSMLTPGQRTYKDFIWSDKSSITICEHFHKLYKKTKIYQLSNGDTVEADKLDDRMKELKEMHEALTTRLNGIYASSLKNMWGKITGQQITPPPDLEQIKIVDERTTEIPYIMHYKAIKGHILEEAEFPGTDLPIIFLDGDSHWINGRQCTKSFIRYSKDAQRLMNFCVSEVAEWLKTRHKTQFLTTESQISNYIEQWRNPEKSHNFLMYSPDVRVEGGKPTPIGSPELPATLLNSISAIPNMIENILGRYTANKGEQGNEVSGTAVNARIKQGNNAIFVNKDNLNKAIEQTGKICLKLIPKVYSDKNRTISIIDQENKSNLVSINQNSDNTLNEQSLDLMVTLGADLEQQKIDNYQQISALTNGNPQVFTLLADLLAQNTNLTNTQQIVDRLRKYVVPPQVIADETGQPPPPPQPNPQVEIAQQEAQARLMEAQAKLNKVQQDAQVSNVKASAEIGKANLDYHAELAKHANNAKTMQLQNENEGLKRQLEHHKNILASIMTPNNQGPNGLY